MAPMKYSPDFFVVLLAIHLCRAEVDLSGGGGGGGNEVSKDSVSYTKIDTCSTEHQVRVWQSEVRCRPRPTLVELPLPSTPGDAGSILQVIPGHVMVDRCSGSCSTGPAHSCLPTAVENATLEVMAVQTTYSSGAWNTLCSVVRVERHTACECSCRVRPEDCDQGKQYYDSTGCKCRCKNQAERLECLSSGKLWDDSTCSCICPRRTWRPCSTGFSFDYRRSCRCVRVHAAAAGGVLTALVVLASAALLVMGGALVHFKRRRDAEDRLAAAEEGPRAALAAAAAAGAEAAEDGGTVTASAAAAKAFAPEEPAEEGRRDR